MPAASCMGTLGSALQHHPSDIPRSVQAAAPHPPLLVTHIFISSLPRVMWGRKGQKGLLEKLADG